LSSPSNTRSDHLSAKSEALRKLRGD
jgi:hypothetical protein